MAREFRIEGDRLNPAVAIFFGAYVFVVCLVLLNVVVAVLLDQFINTMSMEKEQESEEKDKEKRIENGIQDLTGSLDPLMVSLSKFSSDDELQELIDSLFEVIDADQNGELDFEEARLGFDRLVSKNALDVEEWGRLTQGLLEDGHLSEAGFSEAMRRELSAYTQRQIVNAMGVASNVRVCVCKCVCVCVCVRVCVCVCVCL